MTTGIGLEAELDQASRKLATLFAFLDDNAIDDHQPLAYDAALSAAEFAAARATIVAAPRTSLGVQLARHWTARSLRSFETRCRVHFLATGLAFQDFPRESLRPLTGANLEELGAELLAAPAYLDDALLDGPHRLLRSTYREFAERRVVPVAEEIHRGDLSIPQSLIQGLADMGCFGLSIPESHGGLSPDQGSDCLGMLLATEELSRASLGAAGSLITRPEVLARALLAGGTDEQKRRWLPRIASGEALCAVSVTEPDQGSDVASIGLQARACEGGWQLSGTKLWTTFAGRAHVLMVLARTGSPDSGHRGLSLFLVEKPSTDQHDFEVAGDRGSLKGRAIATLGYRGMHSYELFFDQFFVPAANLVGGPAGEGRGFYQTMAGFAGGRIQTAARAVGVMQAAYGDALDYAHQRQTFGRPIGSYGLVRAKLVEMASKLHACRTYSYSAAALMDAGKGDVPAAMAKLLAARCAEEVTREALQLHGGLGYAEETAVSRYWVDARVLSIFEGAEEILALKIIARALAGAAS